MDFALSEEQRLILGTVQSFVKRELIPLEPAVQAANVANQAFPDKDTWKALRSKAKEYGLWGLQTPAKYGGAELDATTSALVILETGRALVPFTYGGFVPDLLLGCTPYQEVNYLIPTAASDKLFAVCISEPDAGSDATQIKTAAVKHDDKWVLNGVKAWVSRGSEADYAIVLAVTDKEKGTRGGMTAFLVDREMGFTTEPIALMAPSMKGEPQLATLYLTDVVVPEQNILGEVGQGFRRVMETIGAARLHSAAQALGTAQRLIELGVDYAKIRKSFGHTIGDHQGIQWMIAESAMELNSARWLLMHAAWLEDRKAENRYEQAMAKLSAAETAWRVVDRVMQIHGAFGYAKELPIERVMRHLRVFRIFEGSDEIQKRNIALALIGGRTPVLRWD